MSLNSAHGVVVRIVEIKWEHGLWAFSEGRRENEKGGKMEDIYCREMGLVRDRPGNDRAIQKVNRSYRPRVQL